MQTLSQDDYNAISLLPTAPYWVDEEKQNVYRYWKSNQRWVYERVCRYIVVSKIIVTPDHKQETIELTFRTAYGSRKSVEVQRGDLTQKRYDQLADKGIDITDSNYKHVLAYLQLSEPLAPVGRFHYKLGWHLEEDGSLAYRHHEVIGHNVPPCSYKGPFRLEPAGTLEAWTAMIREQVQGRTAMELVLVAGFSAMVVPRLRAVSGYDALWLHLVGNSSIGKTTAERLAISAFANPLTGGLVKQWTATTNALLASFDGNFGLPMAVDESSAATIPDFSPFIYMFSQGHGRERAKANGALREAAKWSFTLLSSGEARLPRNNNAGLDVRLLEIANHAFTDSAENAEAIQRVIYSHYGYPAIALANYLLDLSNEQLEAVFDDWKQDLLTEMEHDQFSRRTVGGIALLVQTACYVNQALGLGLDVDKIAQLLITLDSQQERDIGEQALEALIEYTVSHGTRFSDGKPGQFNYTGNIIGTNKVAAGYQEITVLKGELPRILGEAGFSDVYTVLARWKDQGLLDYEKDRYTRKRMIGLSKVPVYVIKSKSVA